MPTCLAAPSPSSANRGPRENLWPFWGVCQRPCLVAGPRPIMELGFGRYVAGMGQSPHAIWRSNRGGIWDRLGMENSLLQSASWGPDQNGFASRTSRQRGACQMACPLTSLISRVHLIFYPCISPSENPGELLREKEITEPL